MIILQRVTTNPPQLNTYSQFKFCSCKSQQEYYEGYKFIAYEMLNLSLFFSLLFTKDHLFHYREYSQIEASKAHLSNKAWDRHFINWLKAKVTVKRSLDVFVIFRN